MSSWQTRKLGAISEMCLGKMLDAEKNKGEFQPYLANINVRWGGFDFTNLNKMRFEKSEQDRYGLKYGDLVVCEGGEPGRCAIWKDQVPGMKIQKALHRVRVDGSYSNEFIYYRMLLAGRNGELGKHFIGSTIKHLTGIGLKQVEFSCPPFEEQKAIAAVLSALDAKIDCNNRINAELEAMAKTLYDYWFVQFDFPDANGKPYKASGGKMVYNATLKREIPAGWKTSTIGETFRTHLGGTPSRDNDEYWKPGEVNWLSSGENPSTFVVSPDEKISNIGLRNSPAKLLPQGTVILSIVRHLRASILGIEAATNQSVVGIVESEKLKHCFIYPYIVREIPRLMALRTGAQQPHINKGVLDESLLVIPDDATLSAYNTKAAPFFLQVQNNLRQNQQLAQLRDWLLPLLMNGQVTVA
jgi:type I restriction enzyme S subunit